MDSLLILIDWPFSAYQEKCVQQYVLVIYWMGLHSPITHIIKQFSYVQEQNFW